MQDLPEKSISEEGGIITVIEWKYNDEGKKVKITRKIRKVIKKEKVNHQVAIRKSWKKFGSANTGKEGFEETITSLGEEIFLKLTIGSNHDIDDQKLTVEQQVKKMATSNITCRICKGDHWTLKCPYKDTLTPLDDLFEKTKPETTQKDTTAEKPTGRYIPPSQRGGSSSSSSDPSARRKEEDATTVRVTNLSEETTEQDLQSLFKRFGPVSRTFLARDRDTGLCKGFAFINYISKESARKAIETMDGYGFDNLILKVDWAKRDD